MMIGVLGTGMVGEAIATKLAALGHDVMMGSRTAGNAKAATWSAKVGARGRTGTFADAAAFGELVFNCTQGVASLDALQAAGVANLDGKILVDVANVLPPGPTGADPLGQRIQAAFPRVKVVKTLNTVNCEIMVDPQRLPGPHTLFVSGDDPDAKQRVRDLVEAFGWRDIVDLGDITTTRATESYLTLWMSLWNTLGTADFNIQVVR